MHEPDETDTHDLRLTCPGCGETLVLLEDQPGATPASHHMDRFREILELHQGNCQGPNRRPLPRAARRRVVGFTVIMLLPSVMWLALAVIHRARGSMLLEWIVPMMSALAVAALVMQGISWYRAAYRRGRLDESLGVPRPHRRFIHPAVWRSDYDPGR